ncbi:MAG: hypothetical protein IJW20_00330 [Clostridia bacterium]|nr:hypothetical protein [Clostridia bacterium]
MKKTRILRIIIIALFLEIILFNITSYRTMFGNYEVKKYTDSDIISTDSDEQVCLEISDINTEVVTFKIEFKDVEEPTKYRIYFSDETTEGFYDLAEKTYIEEFEKSKYMSLSLSGEISDMRVYIDKDLYDQGNFHQVVLNEKIPFEFNILRFLIVLGIMFFAYCMKTLKIFNEEYSNKNLKQEFILIGIITIFLILLTFINTYSSEDITEEGESPFTTSEGIYNKDFVDSLKEGKLYLSKEPSEEFLELENPYDAKARVGLSRTEDYLWDTAYYNGHFYIYFGILPVLLLFLPFNLLTGTYLKMSVGNYIFSVLILILLKEILLKIINRYFKEIPFKNVIYALITLCGGSLVLYANGMSRFYEIVIIAGIYFVLQGLYFILCSMEKEKNRHINIFLGSMCLALSVACRPTDLLASILILPYLIKLFIDYVKNIKENKFNLFKLIISVAIPYISVGSLLMWYNYARFENVFDFGNKYQLTITNMMELGSRMYSVPIGLLCNLFTVPKIIPQFPFIAHSNDLGSFYGYYYIENMLGGVFMLAPICFACFNIIKFNKKTENKELKILVNMLIGVGLLIAIISTAMAGSNQRYLIDYAWMLIFAGILIFISIYNLLKNEESKKIMQKILCITAVYTMIISIFVGIKTEGENMKELSPKEYYETRYTICFWE